MAGSRRGRVESAITTGDSQRERLWAVGLALPELIKEGENIDDLNGNPQSLLQGLPAVHRLLALPVLQAAAETVPAGVLAESARDVIESLRVQIRSGKLNSLPNEGSIAQEVERAATARMAPTLRRAINATGIVLHTGLGRARLADAAARAIAETAAAHCTLEVEETTGRRGSRQDHVRELLREITGAESALVVNNCAGAVFLAVTALAAGREVILSRGELVEIGGAFRMPDIIRASGATLVEVGTTNRTRTADYRCAITDRTALILRCRPSNFAVVGFTESAPIEDLVQLGKEFAIPVMDDHGSGDIIDVHHAPSPDSKGTVRESVSSGCEVVTASGDKLLGGPQAGILLGASIQIDLIASHPLARALRVDKFTLAALEATLRLYRDPIRARTEIPTLRYLGRESDELAGLAETLRSRLADTVGAAFVLGTISERSQVGGGSLPGEDLPTVCVTLVSAGGIVSADEIASRLRRCRPAVYARIKRDVVLFDPRTLESSEVDDIVAAVKTLV